MTTQEKQITTVDEALKNVQFKIERLKASKIKMPTLSSYEIQRNKDIVKASKLLLPIIRAFEREGSRFILPNGMRVRFHKINFQFRKNLKKVDASWGDYLFEIENTFETKVYYSFKNIYQDHHTSALSNIEKIKSINEDEYQFQLSELYTMRFFSIHEFLETYSNEDIEQFAVYGIRSKIDKYEYIEAAKRIEAELADLSLLERNLRQVIAYEKKKDDLIEMVNSGKIDKFKL